MTTKKSIAPSKRAATTKSNVFVAPGIDALFQNTNLNDFDSVVDLNDIEVLAQVREEFEDADNELADLGKSLIKKQLQAILLRPNVQGSEKPYILVAGERRFRAAKLVGLKTLRARIEEMTEADAADYQLAENIHRKNLTQIEEAKKIQHDLDLLGSVDAVLEKHSKGRAWLSKILSLLDLPEQSKRLISENVSADLEVINTVKVIEKVNPEKAKELVDELKATRGKKNARTTVNQVKDTVKPSKAALAKFNEETSDLTSPVLITLKAAFKEIQRPNSDSKLILDAIEDKEQVKKFLRPFFDAGKKDTDIAHEVLNGIMNGKFGHRDEAAFALASYLHGSTSKTFNLNSIFSSVKK
ncbi:ParB/RepB/Spo0J family partition protein (plasmid) [Ampullimonas aquatilis]|uniref:ParB/RepB/Spo0J family partition protein n=1 Tax=Ampullimonas aquatilis TaxID=1341549 RepID=UPI003C762211